MHPDATHIAPYLGSTFLSLPATPYKVPMGNVVRHIRLSNLMTIPMTTGEQGYVVIFVSTSDKIFDAERLRALAS